MHFRVLDLSAERCVWSVPPLDTVLLKLRTQKLVVRRLDNNGDLFDVIAVDGFELDDWS
jgi:hypothetical protein